MDCVVTYTVTHTCMWMIMQQPMAKNWRWSGFNLHAWQVCMLRRRRDDDTYICGACSSDKCRWRPCLAALPPPSSSSSSSPSSPAVIEFEFNANAGPASSPLSLRLGTPSFLPSFRLGLGRWVGLPSLPFPSLPFPSLPFLLFTSILPVLTLR